MDNSTSQTSDRVGAHRCEWTPRCQMTGTISHQIGAGGHYYCLWHYKSLQCPQTSDNAEIFNSFVEQQRNTIMVKNFKKAGLPPPVSPWNEDIRTLRRKVGISA